MPMKPTRKKRGAEKNNSDEIQQEAEVTLVKEKEKAVEFEIAATDRPSKLKPLPAALLNRIMHSTNSNKFEFMKNPNAKFGSSIGSTASTRSRESGMRPESQQSSVRSFGSTITDGLADTLKEINSAAAAERAQREPQCAPEQEVRSKPKQKPPAQVAKTPDELVVATEVMMVEQKANAVEFDIVFNEQSLKPSKGPSQALIERLQQPATKRQPKAEPAASQAEEEEDGVLECKTPATCKSVRIGTKQGRKPPQRRVFGELNGSNSNSNADVCETPVCATPFCATPGAPRQPIGVGVGIEDQPERAIPEPEPLEDELREQCDAWIKLLGLHTVKCLFSKYWQHRATGMKKAQQCLGKYRQAKADFRDKLFRVFAAIAQYRLADSVMQVYQLATDMVKSLMDFGEGLPQQTIQESLELLVPVLLKRAGDGNQRICGIAEELVYWVAKQDGVAGLQSIAKFVTQSIPDANKAYKHVIARLKVITQLVTEHGFQQNREEGLSAEAINRFTLDVVETVNRRVCQDAAEVIKMLYKKLGLRAIHLLNVQVKDNASEDYLQRALGPLITELVAELHSAERTRKGQASDSLLALAMHEKIGAAFVSKCVQQPPEDLFDTAALTARLDMLARMVSTLGFPPGGLATQNVMLYALPGIQSDFEVVRKAAGDLVIACHTKAGDDVWQYLVVEDSEYVKELKKRVISQAKASFRGGGSMKARLATDVGLARAQDRTVAFAERK